jgi:hypothetical protein
MPRKSPADDLSVELEPLCRFVNAFVKTPSRVNPTSDMGSNECTLHIFFQEELPVMEADIVFGDLFTSCEVLPYFTTG